MNHLSKGNGVPVCSLTGTPQYINDNVEISWFHFLKTPPSGGPLFHLYLSIRIPTLGIFF